MWLFLIIISIIGSVSFADMSPNYYCADMAPQFYVSIEQLMGMWYGVEILSHSQEEEYYTRVIPSCPIIHISQDTTYTSTYNPLHKGYDYGYNYGERRGYNNYRTHYGRHNQYQTPDQYQRTEQYQREDQYQRPDKYQHQNQYNRDNLYGTNYNTRRYGSNDYGKRLPQPENEKKLRLWWDENGSGTEYKVRYNVTRPGFWYSSGPQNGSELEPQFRHLAGFIQVIKAVGNHLVLTFCHGLPDRQLFTIILSREIRLDNSDIHGVHNLLNRKGLRTTSIKKVCSSGCAHFNINLSIFVLIMLSSIYKTFRSNIIFQ